MAGTGEATKTGADAMKTDAKRLSDFGDDVWVVCPICSQCAHLKCTTPQSEYCLVCARCGHNKSWSLEQNGSLPTPGEGPVLSGFQLNLWLQVPCCGHTLWAFNPAHAAFMLDLIGARLREREPHPKRGWCNASLSSRLPGWMREGSHRARVMRGLIQLQEMAKKP